MYNMNFYIALLAVITIVLYINTNSRRLLNEPLGKLLAFLLVLCFFYQSPILGIFFIIIIIIFKEYNNYNTNDSNNTPLEIVYKTKNQEPVTTLSDTIIHESGLELLSKELNLRSKESNRDSIVHNTSTSCNGDDDDILCLFSNEPLAHNSSKNFIYSNI